MVINQLRPLYRRCRDLWQHSRPPARTSHGFLFVGSQQRFRQSADEVGTASVLCRLAPALDRFINVGANAGYYCLLADHLGLDVVAFEPEPVAFRLLQRNLALNDSRALVIPAALGNHWQRQSFFGTGTAGSLLPGLSGTPTWDCQRITVISLDQLTGGAVEEAPSMLWLLDCEGAEPMALAGARRTLAGSCPLLILEWQPQRHLEQWCACVDLLLSVGYSHLLACSSLLGPRPLQAALSHERLQDPLFRDNVLIYALPRHARVLALLDHS